MVVRIPNWLGDALMATPVYSSLIALQKEEIFLFGPEPILELLKYFPEVKLLPYYRGEKEKNLRVLKKVKDHAGLLLTNSFSSAWLFFKAGLKERWGYATDLRRCFLTKAIKPPKKKLHQRDYYLYLLEKLGLKTQKKELELPVGEDVLEKAEDFLKREGVKEKYVVFCPGAAYGPAKMWFPEYYKVLAKILVKKGYHVVILGVEREKETGELIKNNLKEVFNFCGKTSLPLACGIIYFSSCVISNDSGLMHLSACLKVPQIAIFGSTDPELTAPLNPRAVVLKSELECSPCFERKCRFGHYRCLKEITPELVLKKFEEVVEARKGLPH